MRDQVAAALAEARHTGWDGLLAEQRAYLDDFWDRPTSSSTATPSSSRRSASRSSTPSRPAPGPSGGAIAAKGLTGPGYDGHAFWDTETFVLPLLTYTAPARRRAMRCAGDTPRSTWHASEPAQLGFKGAAFPWRTIARTGMLGLLARRHRRVSHQRGHRGCRRALSSAPSDDDVRARHRASSCSSRPRGCGAPSAITMPPDASASTASPARTSTARSPTTTSTPT